MKQAGNEPRTKRGRNRPSCQSVNGNRRNHKSAIADRIGSVRPLIVALPIIALLSLISLQPALLIASEISPALAAIRAVGPEGEGHREAIEAAGQLQKLDASHLVPVLAAMDDANPLALNWIRGVAETLVQNSEQAEKELPLDELEQFLANTERHPRARRFAYELIRQRDPSAEERLTPTWVDDPSLELRRDAVNWLVDRADEARKAGRQDEFTQLLQKAFQASRDIDQVRSLTQRLRDAELEVDPADHLGLIRTWNLIGPFDNTDKEGFDAVYPPENEIQLNQRYAGKTDEVAWQQHTTTDDYGLVDLNEALGKAMGAVAYAHIEFHADAPSDVELRLGSINANKVWLNGELLVSNHVYHAGAFLDQYIGQGRLKPGKNSILVKIAQNEQTEAWAQDWSFQLRVCDAIGTPVRDTGSR